MKLHATILVAAAALLAAPAASAAQQQEAAGQEGGELEVAGLVLTTAVADRMPSDTLSTVPADVGRVTLWSRITGASGDTRVEHVWIRGEEETARVGLDVGGEDWRTWSTKRILPSWTGRWRVEVRGPGGEVLETTNFTVEAP